LKRFFLDTNVFLQCRDLKDLPWKDVAEGHDLRLFIPRTVQEEIDRQKGEGNSRRGKRARSASTLFRQIILSPELCVTLKEENPRVEVSFPETAATNSPNDRLDLTRPDDRIIAEIISYKEKYPTEMVYFLTHDTNPLLTCRRLGVPFQIVPDDWLLSPEPDPRDKKIKELEAKLTKLEKLYPAIDISMKMYDCDPGQRVLLDINTFSPLREEEIEQLLSSISRRSPMVRSFDGGALTRAAMFSPIYGSYKKPTSEEIEKYQEVDYPQWLIDLRRFFESYHSTLSYLHGHHVVEFKLTNTGGAPAENLVIEFTAVGQLQFITPDTKKQFDEGLKMKPPSPPKPPEGKWVQVDYGRGWLNQMNRRFDLQDEVLRRAINPQFRINQRDRHTFYWKEKKEGYAQEWTFECEEFRHLVKPETFEVVVVVPMQQEVNRGGISCLVTARNLPTPYGHFFPLSVNYGRGDTFDHAKKMLLESFALPGE
jgi:hypothetical protein